MKQLIPLDIDIKSKYSMGQLFQQFQDRGYIGDRGFSIFNALKVNFFSQKCWEVDIPYNEINRNVV